MSHDRLNPPSDPAELLEGAIRRAHIAERIRIAELIQVYPLENFFYDDQHITIEEILRFRDTMSQCVMNGYNPGEMLK